MRAGKRWGDVGGGVPQIFPTSLREDRERAGGGKKVEEECIDQFGMR